MRVLVAYATRSGATGEFADRIAQQLRTPGHDADVERVSEAVNVATYDAFVIGSAVKRRPLSAHSTEPVGA